MGLRLQTLPASADTPLEHTLQMVLSTQMRWLLGSLSGSVRPWPRAHVELGCALGSPRRRSELIQPPITWSFPALGEEISLGTELPFPEMERCCSLC